MNAFQRFDSPPTRRVRQLLIWLTSVTTAAAVATFAVSLSEDGWNSIDVVLVGLASVLLAVIAFSFWTATLGFIDLWTDGRLSSLQHANGPEAPSSTNVDDTLAERFPPTAVLMPVYNESPENVFAAIEAMRNSLAKTDHAGGFDFFVLSDTTDPDVWVDEELAWANVTQDDHDVRVFYRHRPQNTARKSGNIEDFCRRWGSAYEFMVVLDADSVMAGETLVEMVRRMTADPLIGILQAPPRPVGCDSAFARTQQFAARTYSGPFMRGFNLWAGCDGNYWGHNAIIRTDAFTQHCGLPVLPGQAPLGGEILSHDFVEAALMRRGGYKVCLADDLDGSYEQCPTSIPDYAQRDQRWCQGNLQHGRLLAADGFVLSSRLHLLMGLLSYVASPVWLMFLLISLWAVMWSRDGGVASDAALWLFVAAMSMLLVPKTYGVALTLRDERQRDAQGGTRAIITSAVIESILSVLIAPIMMLYHSQFVALTLLGKKVHWNAQTRDDRGLSLSEALDELAWATVVGVIGVVLSAAVAPSVVVWLLPIFAGLVLAVPLAMMLSHPQFGCWLKEHRLLLIPEETSPPSVLVACERALEARPEEPSRGFWRLVQDPQLLSLHTEILRSTGADQELSAAERAKYLSVASHYDTLSPADRRKVQGDSRLLTDIHVALRSGTRA